MSRAMSLRLPETLADDIALVADCDGETVSDAIRAAIIHWIKTRRADPNFQESLRDRIDHATRLLHSDVAAVSVSAATQKEQA